MASFMLSLTGVLSLVVVLVCGEEVAWGAPGEQSANGLLNTSDRFVRSEVGVEILLILKDFIESDRMVYLSSFESVMGVLNNTDEKLGFSQVGHNHEVSEFVRCVKSVVDIDRQSLWNQTLHVSQQIEFCSHVTGF